MTAAGLLVDRARREVNERLPSCQLAVARDGALIVSETLGEAPPHSRFLMWSCTKALVAGVVWQLAGEGRLEMERSVASYLPEFATNGKEAVTVEHLLLHTAGFPRAPLGPAYWSTSEGRRYAFSRWRLDWPPGTRFEYHPVAAHWVLAELIVAATGRDHRDEVTSRICEPLGLRHVRLGVPEVDQADVVDVVAVGTAPPATDTAAALPLMNTPAARAAGIPGGGAVGTAGEVALYYQALLHNTGHLWDREVLADGTGVVRNTFRDEPKGLPANRTRGLVVRGDHAGAERMMHFGQATSPRTFGHDGAGGQIAWADPETGLSFCFLTNGMESDPARETARGQDLSSLAAACAFDT